MSDVATVLPDKVFLIIRKADGSKIGLYETLADFPMLTWPSMAGQFGVVEYILGKAVADADLPAPHPVASKPS